MRMQLGWLFSLLGLGGLSLQTLFIAGAVLVGSNLLNTGVTSYLAYNAGWRNANNAHEAAVAEELRKHTAFLLRMANLSGALSDDDRAAELSNDQVQRKLENAIGQASDGAECFPPLFLRDVAELR